MNNPVIACSQLTKVYADKASQIRVLEEVNFQVASSEMVAIIGNSGSGKSTFLHLLGGLDHPTSGQVFLNGQDFHRLSENQKCRWRNQCLGFVYQFHHLLPEFTAIENVGMPLLMRGESPHLIYLKSADLLEKVGLKNRMQHRLGQLSGGERQRVAIARALVAEPLCVLADEPTGNLDPTNAEIVLNLFIDLQKSSKTSVVMVTHDLQIARRADRVLSIQDGQLVNL